MLRVPELDDITYEQIVKKSINKIPSLTDKWTDFNDHDPGITVIQTYAWLIDMLNYYMNATGDVHVYKYLKLLGITPHKRRPAKVLMCMENGNEVVKIPKGAGLLAENTHFELCESYDYATNRFQSFVNEVDNIASDLTMFAGVDGEFANLFATDFQDTAIAYFGFEKELIDTVSFYFVVKKNEKRNPFTEDFKLTSLKFEYYANDVWVEAEQVKDETGGFLKSGLITLNFSKKTSLFKHPVKNTPHHTIRCILKNERYDVLPKIGTVYVNPFEAIQKKTIARKDQFTYQFDDEITLPSFCDENSYFIVAKETTQENFEVLYFISKSEDDRCEIINGNKPFEKKIQFHKNKEALQDGDTICVFTIAENFLSTMEIGVTDGCVNQSLEFDYPGIYELGITLWREEKECSQYFESWHYVENLEDVGYQEKVFTYDFESKMIVFGDGIHGVLPKQGLHVFVTELSISDFSEGNVIAGEVNQFASSMFSNIKIYNPESAVDGQETESIKSMCIRLETLLSEQNRMVSIDDYRQRVLKTSGLMIEDVTVIPGVEYGRLYGRSYDSNEVVVVAKPYSDQEYAVLTEQYKKRILEYIEPYRLINTKVSVVSPAYVGIEVHGQIVLKKVALDEEEQIEQWIRSKIEETEQNKLFGKTFILGKFFTGLEMLECVKQVKTLSFDRVGRSATKNQRGDIILFEDAISYLRSITIEYS